MEGDERDIPEGWTLIPADLTLVMAKGRANRLGFAVLLLFYRAHGRFPGAPTEIEPQAVDQVARQIGMDATPHDGLDLAARTWKRHRAEIRALFGSREATVADAETLVDWLRDQAAVVGTAPDQLVGQLEARCRELAIEPPSAPLRRTSDLGKHARLPAERLPDHRHQPIRRPPSDHHDPARPNRGRWPVSPRHGEQLGSRAGSVCILSHVRT